jgi:DNA polymerase-4
VVEPEETLSFLRPLPVESLWGVGPATLSKLHRIGVLTIADLADLPEENVVAVLGRSQGRHLHSLANGHDERSVEPDRTMKSIGHEETFSRDHHLRSTLEHELVQFADSVASRLRAQGLVGRTVQLKVRFGDFTTITRSTTLAVAVDDSRSLLEAGRGLLALVDPSQGVRLLGLSVSGLSSDSSRQLTFDEAISGPGWQEADRTIDEIRARFGEEAIGPAVAAGPDGLRLKRRGAQQWGPNAEQTDPGSSSTTA